MRAASEKDPNNAEILHKLGETLIRLEKDDVLDEAKQIIEQSIKLDDRNSDAHLNLGRIFRRKEEVDASIECFEKALKRAKNPSNVFFYLGDAVEK